ncbi:MAG: hypothetical protein ACJ790_15900 [Myxococcaceae bacterium]
MRRAIISLLTPLLFVVLHELLQWLLFTTKLVADVVGSGRIGYGAVLALLVFYALRLFCMFLVPGWILLVLIRLIAQLRAKWLGLPDENATT